MQDQNGAFFIIEDTLFGVTEEDLGLCIGTIGMERIKNGKPYDQLKKYIKSCAAFQDGSAKIEFTKNKIIFKISLQEAEASFPELSDFFCLQPFMKRFSEENIKLYHNSVFTYFSITFCKPLETAQKELIREAEEYFKIVDKMKNKRMGFQFQPQNNSNDPNETLMNLIKDNDCLAIGEIHTHSSGKKILIDNMQMLKKSGVSHLFMEHILDDTQSDILEKYFESESEVMPVILKNYLKLLDSRHKLDSDNYSFTQLVLEAKKQGIKIIPIDTVASYSTNSQVHLGNNKAIRERYLMMNYYAAKQIEKYKQHDSSLKKYIVYCGSGHVKSQIEDVPGMSEIIGCPALVVEDLKGREEIICINPESHIAKPDVLIRMDTSEFNSAMVKPLSPTSVNLNNQTGYNPTFFKDQRQQETQALLKQMENNNNCGIPGSAIY